MKKRSSINKRARTRREKKKGRSIGADAINKMQRGWIEGSLNFSPNSTRRRIVNEATCISEQTILWNRSDENCLGRKLPCPRAGFLSTAIAKFTVSKYKTRGSRNADETYPDPSEHVIRTWRFADSITSLSILIRDTRGHVQSQSSLSRNAFSDNR